jgi:isoquinoline 1-oxidoreductase
MSANDFLAQDLQNAADSAGLVPSTRREFLKRVAGGIIVFVAFGDLAAAQEAANAAARPRVARPELPTDFNAFLRIDEDGRVTCFTGKIEMGQGPITSLPQMVADELEAPLDSVDIVMGDTDLCPFDMGTWGSLTTRQFGPALRAAAAEAKAVLLELAAETLQVPVARLTAKDGVIFDQQDQTRRITYGQLAKGKKIERHLKIKPSVKDFAQFAVMGKPLLRRDAREKVTGKAQYSADIRQPGMLYAKILRPPAHGAKLTSVDTAPAKEIAGVQVVQDGDLVAVLHELPDVAEQALEKIKAEFSIPSGNVNDRTIFDHLLAAAPPVNVVSKDGDLDEGKRLAQRSFETTYLNSYVAHSAMEPHAALARIEGEKATVWASTQNPFGARDEIARAIGFPTGNVRVITPFVGGGFGGKTVNTQAVEAARLAKATGHPVQVMWSRAEEFYYDAFRPAAVVKIKSGIDGAGKITFWDYAVYCAGDRGAPHFYTIPHHRTAAAGNFQGPPGLHPFAVGAWRAPGNNTNTFARESQIDLMAAAAGIDPVKFRLDHLRDPRMIRVLQAAADHFGWTPAKSPSRRGYGVACGMDAGTWVAAIAEVAVDASKGAVQVKRVLCAQDMGIVINPEGAKIQMEGCITMGLGYALSEEVHFDNGKILDTNFDTYTIPRFSWVPKIETVILEANEFPPQGGGEPAIILMGALIANAIHDATGARLLQLPMTPARVKAALPNGGLSSVDSPRPAAPVAFEG